MGIKVLAPGFFTTIQDMGRFGYQQFGIPVSGAADPRSLVIANLLAGNSEGDAALEATVTGPTLQFASSNCIAVTGARMSPKINGLPIPEYRAVTVNAGDILTFGTVAEGCRAYIAFAGGLDVEPVMGSRSTYVRAAIGPNNGRPLGKGDFIGFRKPCAMLPNMANRIAPPDDFSRNEIVLRVIPGPQEDHFTGEGTRTFYSSRYTVGSQSDRMGCRLQGTAIPHIGDGEILSDGIAPGSIQVTRDGNPIILLADRQPTGGYPKIATVISVDIPLVVQCRGGEFLRFQKVTVQEAQAAYLRERNELCSLGERWNQKPLHQKEYRIRVNGSMYDVSVELMQET